MNIALKLFENWLAQGSVEQEIKSVKRQIFWARHPRMEQTLFGLKMIGEGVGTVAVIWTFGAIIFSLPQAGLTGEVFNQNLNLWWHWPLWLVGLA
ncbi:MAG: hypothetical protein WC631_00010 [Candidatus Paceibacterota bacterium]|jgi:hypothetical protein